ncbi:MAG: LysM peptidoglycan-binding domain-containing protein [Mesorhizobium sp.]|uniref:LysM peptidoglycan-binding domain-containing protein n=1 Tax=Mesorhizobium sp. TaxID=1871066 RepID=UPI000FE57899|nr:LysM peptidoglycan-binding domain-containing protein [Mesorhizobium sp.]RWH84294.1 MAG: LysM peptidoglycan-binding domain-containing protein [Mesorhizobium sp.]RWH86682.1 MAG: LysM peptidoglycan-binding domain-containing protein [Mesorhizobium sp.]RWH93798.1 MAG: LysM peptidoglycan-binding domain-containing protein [Mesorhizobium sp.]RWI02763.1 MAG: LysM peptidoglycan-binding domain-containing protein [Mesorhizobium sp.]RWI05256.1 MAG: LysM peptidoglycan-binding domain-containing protein [M
MTINPVKALLFAVGGSVAAAGTAYVSGALDPYLNRAPPAEVASLTPPVEKPAEPGTDGPPPPAPATGAMAPAASATADAIAPTFDIVRVEIKGSIVVAGNAAPNAKVEILNGSTVLGSTVAGADGAFAIVLDDPLKPGDYTIALRSMTGNIVTPSAQTAVVSIPQSPAGQVLAMIEEPGKPSELLTVPAPETKPRAPAGDKAAAPAAGDPVAAAPAPGAPAATPAPAPDVPVAPATPAAGPKIVVEAIEIDGNKIFVAGLADPGRKVRAYANDILLGDAKTSPDGHFLVEATRIIPVGTYTIHVDALDADGVKVVARAAVPFEREPGESVAAVAPAEQKPATPPAAADATASAAPAASAEIPETVAPRLEHADGAVIIRRHDTLWQISRRVYGQGVRYSTIYLANQDQIRNPDRIWPGQVFKVPEKSQEGEAANLKAMGDQMTTAPTKAD